MLQKYKDKREEGFTIIEVLIVLAIAGLIILIVFLAVPALQRNSRNTQRSNDAARVSGAINECLGNNNGNLGPCNFVDGGDGQVTDSYLDTADNQQLINVTTTSPGALDAFYYQSGAKCDNNTISTTNVGARSFVIGYQVETSGAPVNRCVGS